MRPLLALFLSCALFSSTLFSPTTAQTAATCQSYSFSNGNTYAACLDLPALSSFLHWNYTQSTGVADIAFRRTGTSTSRWISWAINPSGLRMVGCQALVAYQNSNGSMRAYTSSVDSLGTTLAEGALSFGVPTISASFENGGEMTIFARLQLAGGTAKVNQVWQEGPMDGEQPSMHSTTGANTQSVAELDLVTATSVGGGGGGTQQRKKNVHGVLNAVSWGTLMPMGALIARYLKVFQSADPAWFYLHVACQTSAYIVGVAGWATGLKLGSGPSPSNAVTVHGNIGIALFTMGTLQVFALLLRPKKDHKLRIYWNAYHHSFGYAVIALSIVNVFKGLDILNPGGGWKRAYIGIVIGLGVCALALEAFTWYVVIKRKKKTSSNDIDKSSNGYRLCFLFLPTVLFYGFLMKLTFSQKKKKKKKKKKKSSNGYASRDVV